MRPAHTIAVVLAGSMLAGCSTLKAPFKGQPRTETKEASSPAKAPPPVTAMAPIPNPEPAAIPANAAEPVRRWSGAPWTSRPHSPSAPATPCACSSRATLFLNPIGADP